MSCDIILSLRAVACNCLLDHLPLMLQMKLPVVNRIHPQSNKLATCVEHEAIVNSKHNDSPVIHYMYMYM